MYPMPASSSVAAGQPPEVERRGPERRRVLIPAIIACDEGAQYRCVVRDISETGAKLGVSRRYRLPERFRIITSGRTDGFPVRRAWQRGDYAGVMLEVPATPAP